MSLANTLMLQILNKDPPKINGQKDEAYWEWFADFTYFIDAYDLSDATKLSLF